MTLIKLDNGDYVNTDHIMAITADCQMAMDVQSRFRDGDFTKITEADRDRIVEEMTRPSTIADLIDKLDQVDGHLGYIYGGMLNGN